MKKNIISKHKFHNWVLVLDEWNRNWPGHTTYNISGLDFFSALSKCNVMKASHRTCYYHVEFPYLIFTAYDAPEYSVYNKSPVLPTRELLAKYRIVELYEEEYPDKAQDLYIHP